MSRRSRANLGDPAHQRPIGRGIGTINQIGPLGLPTPIELFTVRRSRATGE